MFSLPTNLLIKHPIYRNYLAASTISLLGSNIFDIAMPLYIFNRTQSPMALALVSLGLNLPYFLTAPFTGYTVDHFDKRKVMLVSDIGQALTMLLLIVYDLVGSNSLWPILILVFAAKTLMILFETVASFHLIPALVPPESLADANTWFLSSQRLIQILGPIMGGLLMTVFGFKSCIFANFLSFGATLFFVFRMKNLSHVIDGDRLNELNPSISPIAIFKNFRESVRYIWRSSLFRPFIFTLFCWNLTCFTRNSPSVTFYFNGLKNFSPADYGFVMSLVGFMELLGFFWATGFYRRFEFAKTFSGACFWQAAIATIGMCFYGHPFAFAVMFGVSRMGSSIISMGTFLIRQTEVPRNQIGAVNASIRMHFMLSAPLSAIAQGVIIEHLGVGTSFVLGVVTLWATFWLSKKVGTAYVGSFGKADEVSAEAA